MSLSAMAMLAAASPARARPLDDVKAAGTLRVTVYRDFKPFSWIENGQPKGIDVEIGAALAKALGVAVSFVDLRADDNIDDDLRNGVWRGSVVGDPPGDVMMHVPYDKAIELKNDLVKLVAPYAVDGLAMAVAAGQEAAAADFSLFEREKVAVEVGTLADMALVSARERRLIPNVVHVRGAERAAQLYARGEVSAFYGAASEIEPLAAAIARPTAIVRPKTPFVSEWTMGLAVRINGRDLGYALGDTIEELKASGELGRIFARHGVTWRAPKPAE